MVRAVCLPQAAVVPIVVGQIIAHAGIHANLVFRRRHFELAHIIGIHKNRMGRPCGSIPGACPHHERPLVDQNQHISSYP
jgi:hypothetical protein